MLHSFFWKQQKFFEPSKKQMKQQQNFIAPKRTKWYNKSSFILSKEWIKQYKFSNVFKEQTEKYKFSNTSEGTCSCFCSCYWKKKMFLKNKWTL